MMLTGLQSHAAWSIVWLALWLLMAGCSQTPSTPLPTSGGSGGACPDDVDDLSDAALADLVGPGFVAAVAMVHRFVDSPDPQYRGYDISITTRIAGLAAADQVMFVSVDEPLPAITLGKDAIVVGVRGPRPLEISPYDLCPPRVPLAP